MEKTKSAPMAALVLFFLSTNLYGALPLTETIYSIPESQIEFSFREELLKLENDFKKDTFSIGIGVLPNISLWYTLNYLHRNIIKNTESELGDSFFKVWLYLGEYFEILQTGFTAIFRLPTGIDVYTDDKWQNLAFGNNELKSGPVFQLKAYEYLFMHFNFFYVFRQGENEGFYNGFYYNLFEKETYTKIFGLNYSSEDTFLEKSRVRNDFIIFSSAINTDFAYPVIIYIEFYTSFKIFKKKISKNDNMPIEGAGVNPVFISFGARYFFSESVYLGIYCILNPKNEKKFIKHIAGFDFSLQF